MRLHKIRTYYTSYLERFYVARPELAGAPYARQSDELMSDCFGAADFWAQALAGLGYETFETIANVEPMQRQWLAETCGERCSGVDDWLLEITARQVAWFAPTILFVADYVTFDRHFLRQLRHDNPSIRLVVGWCGAAYSDARIFHEYDIVLSCVPELVADFTAQGHRAFHVNHAFAPQILEKIDAEKPPTTDFSFLGSIVKRRGFHNERERLLLKLLEATDIQIHAEVASPHSSHDAYGSRAKLRGLAFDLVQTARRCGVPDASLASLPFIGHAAHWTERPGSSTLDERIESRVRPALWGRAMYQQLHDTRVSLNTHIDISHVSASNMRLFEATGVGSCLLTDWRANITTLFEPDMEVVTYRSAEECIEKVDYLLCHEQERASIARAGQQRTLRDHTYRQWAERINEVLRGAMR